MKWIQSLTLSLILIFFPIVFLYINASLSFWLTRLSFPYYSFSQSLKFLNVFRSLLVSSPINFPLSFTPIISSFFCSLWITTEDYKVWIYINSSFLILVLLWYSFYICLFIWTLFCLQFFSLLFIIALSLKVALIILLLLGFIFLFWLLMLFF